MMPPTFLVYRPAVVNGVVLAREVAELRARLDALWRARALHFVASVRDLRDPTRVRFASAFTVSGSALSVAHHVKELPSMARRIRPSRQRAITGANVNMKEVLDWTFYLRVAAARGIGVTLAGRIQELGGSLRSFRRLCRRLKPWIPEPPKLVSPQMIVDALVRRLTPPSGLQE